MNTRQNCRVFERTGRRRLMLVCLLAAGLTLTGVALAQSTAGTKRNAKAGAQTQTAKNSETPAAKPGGRGSSEGIKVHGHWTIEVRNPDGKLVSHSEFENGLCTTPSGLPAGYTYGDYVIATLLAGNSVAGGWAVELGNPAIPSPSNPPLPCATGGGGLQGAASVLFVLVEPGFTVAAPCANVNVSAPNATCFPTLAAPTVSNSYPVTLTLSGSFTVPTGTTATITAVGTFVTFCAPEDNPSQCLSLVSPAETQLTGTYLAPPQTATPVMVSGSQTVTVMVQLSFS